MTPPEIAPALAVVMRTAPEEARSDEPERIDTEPPVLTYPCRGRVRGAAGLYQHVAAAADPAGAKLMSPPAPVALAPAPVARVRLPDVLLDAPVDTSTAPDLPSCPDGAERMRIWPESCSTAPRRAAREQRHAAAVARGRVELVRPAGLHEHAAAVIIARADLQRDRAARAAAGAARVV